MALESPTLMLRVFSLMPLIPSKRSKSPSSGKIVIRPLLQSFLFLGAFAVLTAGTWESPALAQGTKVGIIDVQRVMRESTAVQTLTKDVEAQRQGYQAELKKKEEALREEDQTLAKQRSVLSASAFAEKRAELEKKIVDVQREVQELRRTLDQRFGKGMAQVQAKLGEISKEIAEEKALDLILSKATVVIVKPELEITKDAIDRLNGQLPKVELPLAGQE